MEWFLLASSVALVLIISLVIPITRKGSVSIGGSEMRVDVARSVFGKARGLMGRALVDDGMLFVFLIPIRPTFWNFGMKVPIDVVWLRKGVVVGVEIGVPAYFEGMRIFSPDRPIDAALELPAGSIERLGIRPCDIIEMKSRS